MFATLGEFETYGGRGTSSGSFHLPGPLDRLPVNDRPPGFEIIGAREDVHPAFPGDQELADPKSLFGMDVLHEVVERWDWSEDVELLEDPFLLVVRDVIDMGRPRRRWKDLDRKGQERID